jgi:hypothetical protein
MAELMLSVIGAVPVIIEAIRAYRKLHSYVKTARKCVHHLRDICLNLDTQRTLFLNECIFLLGHTGQDEAIGQSMVSDLEHPKWTDSQLEGCIRRHLGDNYELCHAIISRIHEIQYELSQELEPFKQLKGQKQEVRLFDA